MNVDALSRNPMGPATNDNDFSEKIQDIGSVQADMPKIDDMIFSIQTS
jgi:hypothetical protein